MIQFTDIDYKEAHKFCTKHSEQLKNDKICGCFHCLAIFSPDEIKKWLPERKRVVSGQSAEWIVSDQRTALCPHCGVDSVLGESSGYPMTKEFLGNMKEYWFS